MYLTLNQFGILSIGRIHIRAAKPVSDGKVVFVLQVIFDFRGFIFQTSLFLFQPRSCFFRSRIKIFNFIDF